MKINFYIGKMLKCEDSQNVKIIYIDENKIV